MNSVEQPWGPGEPLSLGTNSLEVTPEVEDGGKWRVVPEQGKSAQEFPLDLLFPLQALKRTSLPIFPQLSQPPVRWASRWGDPGKRGELCHPVKEKVRVEGSRAQASGFSY